MRKMITHQHESTSVKGVVANPLQDYVLAALRNVPLDRARLFDIIVRPHGHARRRWSPATKASADRLVYFFDTLALLQAGGLISCTAHPVEDRRLYYLTEKGNALIRDAGRSRDSSR